MQHQAGKVAGQQQVAAAAEHQPRHGGQHGIGQRGAQLLNGADAQIGGGTGLDAESVQLAQGEIMLDGKRWVHGENRTFLLDYRAEQGQKRPSVRRLSVKMSHL
jgi:hypothetical protein